MIMAWLNTQESLPSSTIYLSYRLRPHLVSIPAGYFDEAEQQGTCGCDAWIKLEQGEHYYIHSNGGLGITIKWELITFWSLLWFSYNTQIHNLSIYGDAKAVIDAINDI